MRPLLFGAIFIGAINAAFGFMGCGPASLRKNVLPVLGQYKDLVRTLGAFDIDDAGTYERDNHTLNGCEVGVYVFNAKPKGNEGDFTLLVTVTLEDTSVWKPADAHRLICPITIQIQQKVPNSDGTVLAKPRRFVVTSSQQYL